MPSCEVPGCDEPAKGAGLCARHYHQCLSSERQGGDTFAERRALLLAEPVDTTQIDQDVDGMGMDQRTYTRQLYAQAAAMLRRRMGDADPCEWTATRITLPFGDGWRGDRKIHWEKFPLLAQALRMWADPVTRVFQFRTATQSGKSVLVMCMNAIAANQSGGNTIIALPSQEMQGKYVRTKLLPAYTGSDVGFDGQEQDNLILRWDNGSFTWVALCSSTQALADTSGVVNVIADEFDENAPNMRHDFWKLLADRVRPQGDRGKLARGGTPRRTDVAGLQARAESMRQYVPEMCCTECGEWSVFEMEHIKWPEGVDRNEILTNRLGYAVCPVCGCALDDKAHSEMILGARFRVHKDGPAEEKDIRIPGWCTWQTNWSRAAYEYLGAQGDPIAEVAFWNSVAALAVDIAGANVLDDDGNLYLNRRGEYACGIAPEGCQAITAGIDLGVRTIWWWVMGWGPGGRWAMIDAGAELYGDEAGRSVEAAFAATEHHVQRLCEVNLLPFRGGFFDSGDNATIVYDLCKSAKLAWLPAHGSTHVPTLWREDKIDPQRKYRGRWSGLILIGHHTHRLQDLLEYSLSRSWDDAGGSQLPKDVDARVLTHLRNCVKVEKLRTKSWDKKYKGAPDHLRDAACLAMLAGVVSGASELKEPVSTEVAKEQEKAAAQSLAPRVVRTGGHRRTAPRPGSGRL
jgi:phage terminase large subunit GpA-like protein